MRLAERLRLRRGTRLKAALAVALAVRAIVLAFACRLPSFTHYRLDAEFHDRAARLLAAGDWRMGQPVLEGCPLYLYFLGAIYRVAGAGPWAPRLVQLALGVATVALVYDSARRLFGDRWALVAGLAAALYGPMVFEELQVEPEALAAFLYALLAWSVLRLLLEANARPTRWILPGVALGLCILVRATALLLALPIAVAAARAFGRGAIRPLAAGALVAALTVTPVALRNLALGGDFGLRAFAGGMNFFIGNGPGADGTFRIPPETPRADNIDDQQRAFRDVAERALQRPLTAREVDRYWWKRTAAGIAAAPGAWLRLMGRKLLYYFDAQEPGNTSDFAFQRRLVPALWLAPLDFGLVAPLALIGALLLARSRRPEGLLFAGIDAMACAGVVLFFVIGRYRIAAVPAALVSAIAGARWLVAQRGRRLALAAALLVALLALAYTPRLPEPLADEWFKLGYAWQVQSQPAQAEDAYLHALAIEPRHLSAHKNLALLYETQNDIRRAVVHWQWVYGVARAKGDAGLADYARSKLAGWGQPATSPF